MNSPKPIRRHSRFHRALMNAEYYAAHGSRFFVGGWLLLIIAGCLLLSLLGVKGLVTVFADAAQWGSGIDKNLLVGALFCGAFSLLCCAAAACFGWIMFRTVKAPTGSMLDPERPNVNEALPEAEVLVRASSISDATQKDILLRPAVAAADANPETLLRAADRAE